MVNFFLNIGTIGVTNILPLKTIGHICVANMVSLKTIGSVSMALYDAV